ncbi:hypothetical protein LMH87_000677 [Akanthomyces muscarius]|uniref:Uncharacterized protein n=1 Tax=Akanthomyces muscarius TaxID=2231603 RepID=A0A9W8UP36_AKAMU|nr:hypothetical protein LMH87_000677 [Akanthomyces muscarius]KAJ4155435.1 hypothetical protein LMH87_000677 [Akanthomyces muscarius]
MRFLIALLLPTAVFARYGFPYQCGSGNGAVWCKAHDCCKVTDGQGSCALVCYNTGCSCDTGFYCDGEGTCTEK